MKRERIRGWVIGIVAVLASVVVFLIPFAFIFVTAAKSVQEASNLDFSWPTTWQLWDNIQTVMSVRQFVVLRAFINSTTLTVFSVGIMVVLSAMIGYVLQRRSSRWNGLINFLILAGLIIPPAVVPTIWVLHEAAVVDGAGPLRLFFSVIMPLLKPVVITVIVVQAVAVFNDFTGPLYFLPGNENVTVQLTLYNFQGQMLSQWNLLFTNILLITVPPLIMYIFFNRQIVAGMTSGAVKG